MHEPLSQRGFTLIELMIVVTVIVLLAGLAYPSYARHAARVRRADGKELLMRIAAMEERYYTSFNRYGELKKDLALPADKVTSDKDYYQVSLAEALPADGQSYTLQAVPATGGAQAKDACKTLTLDNTGVKGRSGDDSNGACW